MTRKRDATTCIIILNNLANKWPQMAAAISRADFPFLLTQTLLFPFWSLSIAVLTYYLYIPEQKLNTDFTDAYR